MMLLRMG